ncbi:hypothetical protein ElyMa_001648700 [Elysia marginata]|uniref:Uncharacterized protein n=1 Tax=Elysia marginata TaxID=1093978 RepID=A0AAV4JQM0_9GAST|nr:hypothetical protein ElyMa_001648700 [Elysia marginata]
MICCDVLHTRWSGEEHAYSRWCTTDLQRWPIELFQAGCPSHSLSSASSPLSEINGDSDRDVDPSSLPQLRVGHVCSLVNLGRWTCCAPPTGRNEGLPSPTFLPYAYHYMATVTDIIRSNDSLKDTSLEDDAVPRHKTATDSIAFPAYYKAENSDGFSWIPCMPRQKMATDSDGYHT